MTKFTPDELHAIYEGDYVDSFPTKDNGRLKRLLPLMSLQPDDHLVDYACGNGLLLDFVHTRVKHYTGVDFSERFIAAAQDRQRRQRINNADFICQDIIEFCADHPNTFNVATAMDFTEHIYDPEFLKIFRAIRVTLKPDGKLYLHTPNANFFLERLKLAGLLRTHPEHIGVRTGNQYRRLLEQSGFEKITVHEIGHYLPALAWLHLFGQLPWIGRLFRARLFIECSPGSNKSV